MPLLRTYRRFGNNVNVDTEKMVKMCKQFLNVTNNKYDDENVIKKA
jgi:hypothetical protein